MQDQRVGKRPTKTLSAQEKLDAIDRVRAGKSKASVARDIGVPESTLRGWCKSENKIRNLARRSPGSPIRNPNSPDSSSGAEPMAMGMSSSEDDDISRAGPSKRRRIANMPSYSPPPQPCNDDSIETRSQYVQNWYNTLIANAVRPENSLLLQQLAAQIAAQNAAHLQNLLALNASSGLVPQTVGLVENGLQYTNTSGASCSSNGHSSKRHSVAGTSHYSAIAPTMHFDNKSSRKSVPAAAEAPSTPLPASPRTNDYQNGVTTHQYQNSWHNVKTEPEEAAAGAHSIINSTEALDHGKKFADWLEKCNDPAVSQLNVLQIKYMLYKLETERPTSGVK